MSESEAPQAPVPVRVVLCTCNERESLHLAHQLVSRGLAACVNLVPKLTSIYVWDGEVCEDRENLLVIKTTAEGVALLREAIHELHPYAVPEILVLPVDAEASSHEYVRWLSDAVIPPGDLPE